MIEVALAALAPALALWGLSRARRFDDDFRAAVTRWFLPLVLLWFAPCWLTARSPAPFDYLRQEVHPWVVPGARAGNALLSDVPLQFAPWREVVTRAYRSFELPLLNRHAGAGSPLWANPQAGVLSPFTILGLPFSTFAWPLFAAVTKLLVALTGMYLFVRSRGASHLAAVFSSIAFSFSAFSIAWLLFPHTSVTVLLPWLLLAIDHAARTWRGAAAFAFVLFLLFCGGHPESVLHASFIALPYGLLRRAGHARIILGGVAGCLLAAPLLVPFAAMLPHAERTARLEREVTLGDAPRLTLENLSAFVLPHALDERRDADAEENFNEVATQYAGLATFALMLVAFVREPKRQLFWLVLFALFTLLAFRSDVFRGIPILGQTLHGRVRVLLAFITAVVAAAAFDRIRNLRVRQLLPAVLAADLALLLAAYHPPVSRDAYYPKTPVLEVLQRAADGDPFRLLALGPTLSPNTAAMAGVEDLGVHDPMSFEPYGAMLARAGYDRRIYFNAFRALPPRPLLDHLGVRYVVAPPGARSSALPVRYAGRDAVLFENPTARPRFFSAAPAAGVTLAAYGRNGAEVTVRAPHPVRVESGEIALPGWTLTRDGAPWPLEASGLALAWRAPAGESRFVLRYVPPGLQAGAALAVIGLLLLLWMVRRPVSTTGIASSCAPLGNLL